MMNLRSPWIFFILLFLFFCVGHGYAEDKPAPRKDQGGVLGKLSELEDAVRGAPEERAKAGEMPEGPADEKFSDFVNRARADMEPKQPKPAPPSMKLPDSTRKNLDLVVPAPPPRDIPPVGIPRRRPVPVEPPGGEKVFEKSGPPETVPGPETEADPGPATKNEGGTDDKKEGKEPDKILAGVYRAAKVTKWGAWGAAKAPSLSKAKKDLKGVSEAGGKAADVLKAGRFVDETMKGRREGATKAMELIGRYGSGPAGPIVEYLTKAAGGATEATAKGMDMASETLDHPTEENSSALVRHVEDLPHEIAKNAGLDTKKAQATFSSWRDSFYDAVYKIAPSWIPEKERLKRDWRKENDEAIKALQEYAERPSAEE